MYFRLSKWSSPQPGGGEIQHGERTGADCRPQSSTLVSYKSSVELTCRRVEKDLREGLHKGLIKVRSLCEEPGEIVSLEVTTTTHGEHKMTVSPMWSPTVADSDYFAASFVVRVSQGMSPVTRPDNLGMLVWHHVMQQLPKIYRLTWRVVGWHARGLRLHLGRHRCVVTLDLAGLACHLIMMDSLDLAKAESRLSYCHAR